MNWLMFMIAITVGGLRFTMPHAPLVLSWPNIYKDFSHILVGVLLGAFAADWRKNWFMGALFLGLTALEVAAFFLSK